MATPTFSSLHLPLQLSLSDTETLINNHDSDQSRDLGSIRLRAQLRADTSPDIEGLLKIATHLFNRSRSAPRYEWLQRSIAAELTSWALYMSKGANDQSIYVRLPPVHPIRTEIIAQHRLRRSAHRSPLSDHHCPQSTLRPTSCPPRIRRPTTTTRLGHHHRQDQVVQDSHSATMSQSRRSLNTSSSPPYERC